MYCNNNPANSSDETGKSPLISGLIGAGTAAICGLISGDRGWDVLDAAIRGFIGGACSIVGIILSIDDSVKLGIAVAQQTGNDFYGVLAFASSMGVSFFTGENISKLKGVVNMDEAAQLLFDAFFGFMANVFHTSLMLDFNTDKNDATTASNNVGSSMMSKPSSSRVFHYCAMY